MDNIVELFNKSDVKERKELCLKMIDTFDDEDKFSLLEEIDKRNIGLRVKKVGGNLSLTAQLLIRNNYAGKYIESNLKKELFQNAKLLDNLLLVCEFWQICRCNHPFYKGNYKIVFLACKNVYFNDSDYNVDKKYKITDIVTLMEEFRQEGVIFGDRDSYFVDKDNKQYELCDYSLPLLISRLAKEKKSTLV